MKEITFNNIKRKDNILYCKVDIKRMDTKGFIGTLQNETIKKGDVYEYNNNIYVSKGEDIPPKSKYVVFLDYPLSQIGTFNNGDTIHCLCKKQNGRFYITNAIIKTTTKVSKKIKSLCILETLKNTYLPESEHKNIKYIYNIIKEFV